MSAQDFPTDTDTVSHQPELFPLDGQELLFFAAIAIASGQSERQGVSAAKATTKLEGIFQHMSFAGLEIDDIVDAMYIMCQDALLRQQKPGKDMLCNLAPFRSDGMSRLGALIEAFRDGGEVELHAEYVDIFEGNWEEDAKHHRSSDSKIFEFLVAAFEKYGTVEGAYRLVYNHLGRAYVEGLTKEEFLEWTEVRRTRPGLSEDALAGLTIACIACGSLESVDLSEIEAAELLHLYYQELSKTSSKTQAMKGIFNRTQDALMAFRRDDFRIIQFEPPFSEVARTNLVKLYSVWAELGIGGLKKEYGEIVSRNHKSEIGSNEPVTILSGDGKTTSSPVKFSVSDLEKRVRAENWYINYRFGPRENFWREIVHYTVTEPSSFKLLSTWSIELKDGSRTTVYFDTNREDQ